MGKRKGRGGDDLDGDNSVPLPIQTFFWRQTSAFIKPRQGKICDASCVSFERVVVQNILHGLSPSLCEAIQSVSRWKVIQAAFPHLMHACSSLMTSCKRGSSNKFGANETKLLYTLHWIILDAASECEDADAEKYQIPAHERGTHSAFYMYSLSTVQLFVYLFAPIVHLLKESDFESLKLENGLRLWQPLWDYQQPDIPCFASPVKPQRSILKAQRNLLKVNTNAANIYVGKGTSREDLAYMFGDNSNPNAPDDGNAPLARMSDICTISTSESNTAAMEVVCEHCNTVMPMRSGDGPLTCRCGRKDTLVAFLPDSKNYAYMKLTSGVDKDYVKQKLASATASGTRGPGALDILSASFLDVAVLRCLFCLSWQEDGIYWALRYTHKRMLELCDELCHVNQRERSRSHSLPIPDLQVLMVNGSKPASPNGKPHGMSGSGLYPENKSPLHASFSDPHGQRQDRSGGGGGAVDNRKEPPFKKIRVVELKQFFDSGKSILRKRDGCDADGSGSQSSSNTKFDSVHSYLRGTRDDSSSSCTVSTLDTDLDMVRPSSAMAYYPHSHHDGDEKNLKMSSGGEQRKSMPVLYQLDHESMGSSSQQSDQESTASSQADMNVRAEPPQKPIIKITEHSPEPKPLGTKLSGSNYQISSLHESTGEEGGHSASLPRSYTDSNIPYQAEKELSEIPGSKFYIQDNGHLNYMVVLRAVHFVAMNNHVPRISEVLLNVLNCLLDLDIIETPSKDPRGDTPPPDSPGTPDEKIGDPNHNHGGIDKDITAHSLAMDSLFRIYKSLGCPQGCGDGVTGPQGDHLRMKGQNCLQRLHKLNPPLFHKFFRDTVCRRPLQETIDFLHAFLGFCLDPMIIAHSPQAHKKSASQETLPRSGYTNNFGHSVGGEGYRGVEGVLMANLTKPLVSRCVICTKELYNSENISLFCDIRQLMAYVKEVHGGTYRRVALSGLLDSTLKLKRQAVEREREMKQRMSTPIRRATSVTSESGDEKEPQRSPGLPCQEETASNGANKNRRSIFRKRLTKSLMFQYAASDSEILDDSGPGSQGKLSPRTSISAAEDDPPSGTNTPRRRFSKFNIGRGWRRQAKSDHEDDLAENGLDRRESKSDLNVNRVKGRMSFRTASHATLSFLSARKRIEDGMKAAVGKKVARRGSNEEASQPKNGRSQETGPEPPVQKEKKLVDRYLVKSGMLRFSFMLECCPPGSFPDAQLIAAMLDLEAPVVARAGMLLECAHFIHRCNRGDWPSWMKHNLPSFRHNINALQNRGQQSGYRRNLVMQRAAGRMFYSWAENLGLQLEYILAREHADRLSVIDDIKDDNRRKELRAEDEEEDFLDEATINPRGTDCPYALKMLACLVLLEITTFMRETFQYLPRTRSQKREHGWDKPVQSRRFSSIVSSPGHSDKSSESNIGELPSGMSGVGSPVDRKISFAVLTERSDSFHSSTTSLSAMDPSAPISDDKRDVRTRRLAQGRQKLLRHFRRGSGHNLSFRHNRSFKLKRPDGGGGSVKQLGSTRSRKISSHSLQSDAKLVEEDDRTTTFEDAESVTMLSDETQESPVERDIEVEDEHMVGSLPWIKVVVQLANLSNFICTHQGYCHPNCYERQRRSCSRLTSSVRKMYEASEHTLMEEARNGSTQKDNIKDKMRRRDSIFMVTSPTAKRRESTPLLEKIKTDVSMTKLKLGSTWKKEEKTREVKDDSLILKYLTSQAQRLTQCPMAILTKAAPVLQVENFVDMMPVAWELLLETDQELAAAAATVFLLSSVKSPDKARNTIIRELQHEETNQRINAILRFGSLWKFRYQVWPRMECDANLYFKVPPPSIDFTLPSPTIGLPKASLTVVDPPWMPHFKTKIEEVTVNQEETKSLVTATTTRRKQQQEMIRKALLAEEERKRVGRENFPMTTVPVPQLAAYEPALHSAVEEHEEATQEEINLAARRVSLAPVNRANIQSRSMSWRNGSLHWGRLGNEGEEERPEHSHHLQTAQGFFPSCVCAAVLPILHLLDDHDVNADGVSVSEVANKIIWDCIVDDPILFLRHFLEKLTNKERQEELTFLLRKLMVYFRKLPAQTAHSIFNYLVGFVMFYVRSPCEGGQEAIAGAISLLWLVVPCVEGIYFKDLKQTLKKEQCDPYLLVCANVASAKKILVHGPDLSSIPSQLPIHEDTQFSQILQESLEFFNIPEDQHHCHFIVDTKTHQVHNQNSYVRDFYFFRRNFYPQLSLVKMDPEDASLALQKRVFMLKFIEVGKVLLTNAVLENASNHQNHVQFLHEEFLKLPSFPRKALETEFDMYSGAWGKELFGMDCLHKFSWTKLMTTMFDNMNSTFTWSSDLSLFLNVINGTIILLFEDTSILRFCLSSLINTCRHFKHVFATSGFLYVMPTLLRVYSNNQPNSVLCNAIHFVCRQFYVLHRKPFVLQLFGSVAPLLDMTCGAGGTLDTSKVQPDNLFKMLLALEKDCPDNLGVLDLVHGEKPLKALDFCYAAEPDTFNVMDVINMCVTVIAYAPDSFRSVQMLMVLEMVIPRYLDHLNKETTRRDILSMARSEITAISNIAAAIRALINCSDYFARSMSMPQRYMETSNAGKPLQNHSVHSLTCDDREDSHASHRMEEGRRKTYGGEPEEYELYEEFRRPRDSILSIAAQFWTTCHGRLRQLRKILADPSFRPPELLDHKTHNRLAEIAHTLLKLIPYDPYTMGCTGLQRYMLEILPNTDWSQELVRPALNLILRRLDRLFTKISKKTALRRQCDWEAAANILKGVYQTLKKFAYIAYLPHLKTLVNVLISILLTGMGGLSIPGDSTFSTHTSHRSDGPEVAPVFCSAVVKLVAMQMQALGDTYTLEHICGIGSALHPSDRMLNMLTNFVLPLCIRVGCGCRDMPKLLLEDMQFVLSAVTALLGSTTTSHANHHNSSISKSHYIGSTEHHRTGSVSAVDKTALRVGNELQHVAAFIGLEVLAVCFDKQLAAEWHHVAKCIQQLAAKGKVGLPMWRFLDFLVTHRPSLFLLLHPFIRFKMMRVNCDTAQEYYLQQTIKDKLHGYNYAYPKSTATILLTLSLDLQQLRDQLQANTGTGYRSRTATFATDQTDFSQTQLPERQLPVNLTEIAAEIIGPIRSGVTMNAVRNSKGNLLSRSSSSNTPPHRASDSNMDKAASELSADRSTKRITAHSGSIILEKFNRKPTAEDHSPTESVTLGSPRLQRKPTICLRGGHLSKQNSVDADRSASPAHVAFENEECEALNGRARGPAGVEVVDPSLLEDPREHRLQRQDARSRKTFKIKRQKSKPAVRRFMSHRRRPDILTDTDRASQDDSPSRTVVVFQERVGFQLRRPGGMSSASRSVETIPESAEAKRRQQWLQQLQQPGGHSRSRFVTRSRSHDDPTVDPATATSGSVPDLPTTTSTTPSTAKSSDRRRTPSLSPPISKLDAPPLRFDSPPHSSDSPSHSVGSPTRSLGSPAHRYGSPAHRYGSPSHSFDSPAHSLGSPSRRYASPPHKFDSPAHSSDSSSKLEAPPLRFKSPAHSSDSSSKLEAPPLRFESPAHSSDSSSKLEAPPLHFDSPAHSSDSPPQSYESPPPHSLPSAAQASDHVYVVRCDSSDSLSANESSALLRDEEKSNSLSSLCLYYADEDIPNGGKV